MRPNINDLPNPFAAVQDSGHRRNVIHAAKLLLLTAVLLAVVLAAGPMYRGYQIRQLNNGFADQTSAEKQTRLAALAQYGRDGVRTIVAALGDDDDTVAETADRLLRELQNEWIVLPKNDALTNHTLLVDSIRTSNKPWPDDRIRSAQNLLQQVIQLSVDQSDPATRQLYSAATATLQSLTSTANSVSTHQPLPLAAGGAEPVGPTEDQVSQTRLQPLPVTHLPEPSHWTDWPPREIDPAVALAGNQTEAPQVPAVYQASVLPLQALPTNEIVVLRDVHADRTHAAVTQSTAQETPYHQPATIQPATIQPVAHIIAAPLQATDVATVIGLLDSARADARDQAASELSRRGFDDQQIAIATEIAAGDIQAKIALAESISTSAAVDPRPWLLMLLDDQNREVRLRAISALASLKDPWVQQQLKMRMVDEQDQTVAFRIRRVLNLR